MSNTPAVPAKPTKLLVEKNTNDEMTKGRVEEATLLYVNLQEGELAYGSETERNLAVQMAVTKETARNWKSIFPKNGYREIPTDQFAKTFKTDPPYPDQEDQYILKLKANTTYNNDQPERDIKAGDLIPYELPSRPKVFLIEDGKPVDVTKEIRPANGSKGTVAFRVTTNKFGSFPLLGGVLVTDLIESAQKASIADDFGITADTPSTQRKQLPPAPAAGDAPSETQEPASSGEGDDWDFGNF